MQTTSVLGNYTMPTTMTSAIPSVYSTGYKIPQTSFTKLTPPAVGTGLSTTTNVANPQVGQVVADHSKSKNCLMWLVLVGLLGLIVLGLAFWYAKYYKNKNNNNNNNGNNTTNNTDSTNGQQQPYSNYSQGNGGNQRSGSYLPPWNNSSGVINGTPQDLSNLSSKGYPVFVMQSMDGCKFCDMAKPQMEQFAKQSPIPVIIMNKNTLNPAQAPRTYPQFFLMMPNGTKIPYGQSRSVQGFSNFVQSKLAQTR